MQSYEGLGGLNFTITFRTKMHSHGKYMHSSEGYNKVIPIISFRSVMHNPLEYMHSAEGHGFERNGDDLWIYAYTFTVYA